MLGRWARDILTFLAAFVGFWILLYNLHVEESKDLVTEWQGQVMQYVDANDWQEAWIKKDHLFYREKADQLAETKDPARFRNLFTRFCRNSNIGYDPSQALANWIPDTTFMESDHVVRQNTNTLIEVYLNSKLFEEQHIPSPTHLSKLLPDLQSKWPAHVRDSLESWMNESAVRDIRVSFVRKKREMRKEIKPFCHPLDVWGRIKDPYQFDLFWPGTGNQEGKPFVALRRASDLETAEKLQQFLLEEEFDLPEDVPEALWLRGRVEIDLGNAALATRNCDWKD